FVVAAEPSRTSVVSLLRMEAHLLRSEACANWHLAQPRGKPPRSLTRARRASDIKDDAMTMTRFVTRLGCRPLATIAHGGPRGQGRQAHLGGMSTTHSPEGPMDRSAPLWTLDELCAFLRTTPATVHTWRKSGRGPRAYRVGRHL